MNSLLNSQQEAIIIGGGIGGLCAGIALQRAGLCVAVYEAAPVPRADGAGLTLWPNALRALDRLGLGDAVRRLGVPNLRGGGINDWRGAPLAVTSMRAIVERFGAPAIVVHRAEFQATLVGALGREHLHLGARLADFAAGADGRVRARFADGREASGEVLVGADGLRSVVRRQLFPGARPRYAGYGAWRAIVPFDHDRVPAWGESWGRGTRFGLVPLAGGRVYWFATRNAPAGEGEGWSARSPEAGKTELCATFRAWHAPIPALIDATPADAILRHDIYDLAPLARWGAGPVTLLGDAAHAMTPDLGQSACQAIEDAVELAASLREGGAVEVALRRYEVRRRSRTAAIQRRARRIGRVGQWANPLACALRNRLLGRLPAEAKLRQLDPIVGYEPAPW